MGESSAQIGYADDVSIRAYDECHLVGGKESAKAARRKIVVLNEAHLDCRICAPSRHCV